MSTEPHRYPWQVSELPVFHPAPETPHEPVIDEIPTEPYGEPEHVAPPPFASSVEADPIRERHLFQSVAEEPRPEPPPVARHDPQQPVITLPQAVLEHWKQPERSRYLRHELVPLWMGSTLGTIAFALACLLFSQWYGLRATMAKQDGQLLRHGAALNTQGQLLNTLLQKVLDIKGVQAYDHGRLDAMQPELKQSGQAVKQIRARQLRLERQLEQKIEGKTNR